MNVGETSPGGLSSVYRWGATEEGGEPWMPEMKNTMPVRKPQNLFILSRRYTMGTIL
jgi:hypothetical protein